MLFTTDMIHVMHKVSQTLMHLIVLEHLVPVLSMHEHGLACYYY